MYNMSCSMYKIWRKSNNFLYIVQVSGANLVFCTVIPCKCTYISLYTFKCDKELYIFLVPETIVSKLAKPNQIAGDRELLDPVYVTGNVRREKSPFCALRDTRAASGAVRDKLEREPSTLRVAHSKFLPSLPHWIGSNASVNVRWLRRINTEAQPTTH